MVRLDQDPAVVPDRRHGPRTRRENDEGRRREDGELTAREIDRLHATVRELREELLLVRQEVSSLRAAENQRLGGELKQTKMVALAMALLSLGLAAWKVFGT